jgi:hypothetical protein
MNIIEAIRQVSGTRLGISRESSPFAIVVYPMNSPDCLVVACWKEYADGSIRPSIRRCWQPDREDILADDWRVQAFPDMPIIRPKSKRKFSEESMKTFQEVFDSLSGLDEFDAQPDHISGDKLSEESKNTFSAVLESIFKLDERTFS